MTYRTPDEVTEDNDGHQQSVYDQGTAAVKLSATTSEAKMDSGDPIRGDILGGGELHITNDAETISEYL